MFVLAVEVVAEGLDVPTRRWAAVHAQIQWRCSGRSTLHCNTQSTATHLKDARSSLIYVASPWLLALPATLLSSSSDLQQVALT